MDFRLKNLILIMIFSLIIVSCQKSKKYPVGVDFDPKIVRLGDNGDNWCMTVGEDGSLYTAQCDGRGWLNDDGSKKDFKNVHVWQITGGPDSASFNAKMIHYPDYSRTGLTEIHGPIMAPDSVIEFPRISKKLLADWNWYGYGIVSVDGNLFLIVAPD